MTFESDIAQAAATAQGAAIERANARSDFYVLGGGTTTGPLSNGGAGRVRDALLTRGCQDVRVLRVVEDYETA